MAPIAPIAPIAPSAFTQPPVVRPTFQPVAPFQPQTAVPIVVEDPVVPPTFAPDLTIGDLIFGSEPTTGDGRDQDGIVPTPAILEYVSANIERPTLLGNALPQRIVPEPVTDPGPDRPFIDAITDATTDADPIEVR